MTILRELRDWERDHALRIRASVNAVRRRRGWTIVEFRDRLAGLGWDMSLETLNGMLSSAKRRSFTVGEVLSFAAALDVAPSYLLMGLPDTSPLPVESLVGYGDVVNVWAWVSGAEGGHSAPYFGPLDRYAHAVLGARWHNALLIATGSEQAGLYLREDLAEIVRQRRRWRDLIEGGFDVPDLPPLPDGLAGVEELDPAAVEIPLRDLADEAWLAKARQYADALERSKAELERLTSLGGPSGSATNSAQ